MGPNPCDEAFDACAGSVAGECYAMKDQCEMMALRSDKCGEQMRTCTQAAGDDAVACARAMNRLDQVGHAPLEMLPEPVQACFTNNGVDPAMGPESTGNPCGFAGCLLPMLIPLSSPTDYL